MSVTSEARFSRPTLRLRIVDQIVHAREGAIIFNYRNTRSKLVHDGASTTSQFVVWKYHFDHFPDGAYGEPQWPPLAIHSLDSPTKVPSIAATVRYSDTTKHLAVLDQLGDA